MTTLQTAPVASWEALEAGCAREGAVALVAPPGQRGWCRSLLLTEPLAVLAPTRLDGLPGFLRDIDAAIADGMLVAGAITYEAGYAVEGIQRRDLPSPLAWMGVYHPDSARAIEVDLQAPGTMPGTINDLTFGIHQDGYRQRIHAIKDFIQAGETYQVNFTDRYRFRYDGDAFRLFRWLLEKQPVGYGAFLNLGARQVLSLSPELFFSRQGDSIHVRPMKGTARRGRTTLEDDQRASDLRQSIKDRAENVMIVDLLRNDLGRLAIPGSVRVPRLFEVERYATLLQMTSTVAGTLPRDVRFSALFRALFPCGSITGAPKIRTMEIIRDLESGPRGFYCGGIGVLSRDLMEMNVAIRTIELDGGRGSLGIGSGIVWDSEADAEYQECLLKAHFLTRPPRPDFALFETLLWRDGAFVLLEEHLDRLEDSAHFMGFPWERSAARDLLMEAGSGCAGQHRVRLVLERDGALSTEVGPLPDSVPAPVRVGWAQGFVDSGDTLLFHKTTARTRYDDALKAAREAGLFDVLWCNERGEVTEGCITNLVVETASGERLTPALTCGLLPGVYRRHLLERGDVREATLTPDDVRSARRVWLCNSVRGMVEATIPD